MLIRAIDSRHALGCCPPVEPQDATSLYWMPGLNPVAVSRIHFMRRVWGARCHGARRRAPRASCGGRQSADAYISCVGCTVYGVTLRGSVRRGPVLYISGLGCIYIYIYTYIYIHTWCGVYGVTLRGSVRRGLVHFDGYPPHPMTPPPPPPPTFCIHTESCG